MILDERVYILENALFEASEATPESQTIVSPTWLQLVSPGALHSSANCVFRSQMNSGDIDLQIDQVTKLYQAMGVPFRWLITPLTEPKNTESKLEDKGFSLLYEAEAMIIPTEKVLAEESSSYADNIEVREIKAPELEIYVETVTRAWGDPIEQKEEIREFIGNALEKQPNFHAFIAFKDGVPVGTSLLLSQSGGGYLVAGAVVPEHRGTGIYKAMLAKRAKLAQQLGHKHLMIHAKKETSAPICRKIGFEWVYDYRVYEYKQ